MQDRSDKSRFDFGIKSNYRAVDPNGTAKGVVSITSDVRRKFEDKGWTFTRVHK